jgi:hypothetical protein
MAIGVRKQDLEKLKDIQPHTSGVGGGRIVSENRVIIKSGKALTVGMVVAFQYNSSTEGYEYKSGTIDYTNDNFGVVKQTISANGYGIVQVYGVAQAIAKSQGGDPADPKYFILNKDNLDYGIMKDAAEERFFGKILKVESIDGSQDKLCTVQFPVGGGGESENPFSFQFLDYSDCSQLKKPENWEDLSENSCPYASENPFVIDLRPSDLETQITDYEALPDNSLEEKKAKIAAFMKILRLFIILTSGEQDVSFQLICPPSLNGEGDNVSLSSNVGWNELSEDYKKWIEDDVDEWKEEYNDYLEDFAEWNVEQTGAEPQPPLPPEIPSEWKSPEGCNYGWHFGKFFALVTIPESALYVKPKCDDPSEEGGQQTTYGGLFVASVFTESGSVKTYLNYASKCACVHPPQDGMGACWTCKNGEDASRGGECDSSCDSDDDEVELEGCINVENPNDFWICFNNEVMHWTAGICAILKAMKGCPELFGGVFNTEEEAHKSCGGDCPAGEGNIGASYYQVSDNASCEELTNEVYSNVSCLYSPAPAIMRLTRTPKVGWQSALRSIGAVRTSLSCSVVNASGSSNGGYASEMQEYIDAILEYNSAMVAHCIEKGQYLFDHEKWVKCNADFTAAHAAWAALPPAERGPEPINECGQEPTEPADPGLEMPEPLADKNFPDDQEWILGNLGKWYNGVMYLPISVSGNVDCEGCISAGSMNIEYTDCWGQYLDNCVYEPEGSICLPIKKSDNPNLIDKWWAQRTIIDSSGNISCTPVQYNQCEIEALRAGQQYTPGQVGYQTWVGPYETQAEATESCPRKLWYCVRYTNSSGDYDYNCMELFTDLSDLDAHVVAAGGQSGSGQAQGGSETQADCLPCDETTWGGCDDLTKITFNYNQDNPPSLLANFTGVINYYGPTVSPIVNYVSKTSSLWGNIVTGDETVSTFYNITISSQPYFDSQFGTCTIAFQLVSWPSGGIIPQIVCDTRRGRHTFGDPNETVFNTSQISSGWIEIE